MFSPALKAAVLFAALQSTTSFANPHNERLPHRRQAPSSAVVSSAPGAPASQPAGSAPGSAVPTVTFATQSGKPTMTVSTYAQGATPPLSGAPGLPTPFVFNQGEWPTQDRVPDTSSPEVQAWMKELEGVQIPNITPTVDGTCVGDAAAAADSANRGWWTCSGTTRDTDIVACPTKDVWGVSFDDGPGPYTPNLLNYLKEKDISATFFVVGSRVIERPNILIEEYMLGHEISVHTWSHSKPLTSMTTEQIVAELGWTRKAIQNVLGVTPLTMRPPWGDIDDRVRAISLAMGLIPIIWTRTPSGHQFDTNDWMVPAGTVTVPDSLASFESILGNASLLDTGFIVLQHDIHEITVDMAIGSTLETALKHNPPFKLEAIGTCMGLPSTDLYRETTKNTTFPHTTTIDVDGDSTLDTTRGSTSNPGGALATAPVFASALAAVGAAMIFLEWL